MSNDEIDDHDETDEIDNHGNKPKKYQFALPFDTFDQCAYARPKTWLVENVIALGEDSSWYGPPGAGKSGLLLDLAVHVASCRDWRGYKFNHDISERRGVVYFAIERPDLTKRRLQAYMQRDGLSGLPIAVVSKAIDLLDPSCVWTISHTLFQFFEDTDYSAGLVIIDTFGKAIGRNGDEDKAAAQNLAALNLKLIREMGATNRFFHLASIGHSGKNLASGERGSNARLAHIDLAVQVSGGAAKIVKGNDQAEGELTKFEFEKVEMPGDDECDTKPWNIAILAAATPVTEARPAASKPPTGKNAQALDALRRAIAERGQDGAVHVDYWKEELSRSGRIKADDVNPRATFARIRKGLSQHIIEADNLIRLIAQPGQMPPCPV
ncbi:MAG TPA: AAA family ATPase [Chthoniobacterales bacterium]|nr:AAA family ATPase [Chthoniobacterales bacterium]